MLSATTLSWVVTVVAVLIVAVIIGIKIKNRYY
jgi:hypothetical protein